ncbi:MAG TPA: hypothetical protein VMI13_04270 [Solirubrobacteraceae bacterium]|nr:hypothetical protein [Solirubrobacteraceae bacterium]
MNGGDPPAGEPTQAVTIISPVHTWWMWWLRTSWPYARRSRLVARPLVELSLIHFAHWSLVSRMPPGAKRSRSKPLPYPYLLFQTNFRDDLSAYIDSFALVVPRRIKFIWGGALRFPGPHPPDKFLAFIQENVTPNNYYYCAYPGESAAAIRTALGLVIKHERFAREAGRLGGPEFVSRLKSLVAEPAIAGSLTERAPGPTALIVIAPVREGHEDALRGSIKGIPGDAGSPFAADEGTHFARMTVIPALLDGNGEPTAPARAYLLLTADFDGSVGSWLARFGDTLRTAFDVVLSHCEGYPGAREVGPFNRYLLAHSTPAGFSIISYRATVGEVRYALHLQEELRDLAFHADRLGFEELREEWRERCPPLRSLRPA